MTHLAITTGGNHAALSGEPVAFTPPAADPTQTSPLDGFERGSAVAQVPTEQALTPVSATVTTPHGNLDVTEQPMRVVNPDGSVAEIVSWEIRRGGAGGVPPGESGLSIPDEYLNQAASWLKYEGNLNGVPPRTFVVGANLNQGGAFIAKWHGTGEPGSGRLSELTQLGGSGWEQIPPEIVAQIPSPASTDLLRPNATSYYQVPASGNRPAHWSASYLNEQGQRVNAEFAPGGELARRYTQSSDPSQGFVVNYGPGEALLPPRDGAIEASEGSRVIFSDGGATVINPNGDLRTEWVSRANDVTQFDKVQTVEHLYIDGEASDWRVTTDHRRGTVTLGQWNEAAQRVDGEIALGRAADGSLTIPNGAETAGISGRLFGIPSGTRIDRAAPTAEEASGVTVREIPLETDRLQFSDRPTLERKAGYGEGEDPPWQTYRVELDRVSAQELGIETPAGQSVIQAEIEMLPYKEGWGADRFVMRDGTEITAPPDTARELRIVENVNTDTRTGAQNRVFEFQDGELFLVPSFGQSAHETLQQLADQGLEPVAVLGTGFINKLDDQTSVPVGYHYFNPSRLEPPSANRTAADPTEVLGVEAGGRIRAGYWVGSDGRTHLLNYGQELTPDQVKADLRALAAREDVVAINLFAHRAAEGPEDLLGVMSTEPDRGEAGWTPRPPGVTDGQYDDDPTKQVESRSFLVFDREGELLGRVATPPVAFRDTMNVARSIYGNEAAYVLNGDGDFYTKSWFEDGRDGSNGLALGYENAMILVRPTEDGRPHNLRPLNEDERSAIAEYGRQEGIFDDLRDIWKRIWRGF